MGFSELKLVNSLMDGKPYFGNSFAAGTGKSYGRHVLKAIGQLPKNKPLKVLILGCWVGAIVSEIAKVLSEKTPWWHCVCVDDFRVPATIRKHENTRDKSHMERFLIAAYESGVLRKILQHNMNALGYPGFIVCHDKSALDFLADPGIGKFDLIFINGQRVLPGFGPLLSSALEKITSNGFVCGSGLRLNYRDVDQKELQFSVENQRFYVVDNKTGQWYFPEITDTFKNKFPDFNSLSDFWIIKNKKKLTPDFIKFQDEKQKFICDETEMFKILRNKDKFLVVNNSIFESCLFTEKLGERKISGLICFADTIQEAKQIVKIEENKLNRLRATRFDETEYFILVRWGDFYLASYKYLFPGAWKPLEEKIGERDLPPILFRDATEKGIRRKIREVEAKLSGLNSEGHDIVNALVTADSVAYNLKEQFHAYQIFETFAGDYVAFSNALGRVMPFVDKLGDKEMFPYVLLGRDMKLLKDRISKIKFENIENCARFPERKEWL